jgi:hypothetical protein|uniref:Uncharacterized protein n=1 Tax=viral metagenome TaxID=1070528 RepID=A0A6C0KM97_9ZZZZ
MSEVALHPKKVFVENVQKWSLYDRQLKLIAEKTKVIRDAKQNASKQIIEYMETNKLSHSKIELSDGELKIVEKKDYSPLTFSYIEESLAKIIPEKAHVDYIIDYLKTNREIKVTQEIKRTSAQKV